MKHTGKRLWVILFSLALALAYQWYLNDSAISLATHDTYDIPIDSVTVTDITAPAANDTAFDTAAATMEVTVAINRADSVPAAVTGNILKYSQNAQALVTVDDSKLAAEQIPAVGNKPASSYKAGETPDLSKQLTKAEAMEIMLEGM